MSKIIKHIFSDKSDSHLDLYNKRVIKKVKTEQKESFIEAIAKISGLTRHEDETDAELRDRIIAVHRYHNSLIYEDIER